MSFDHLTDYEKLKEYRRETVLSGLYMKAWQCLIEDSALSAKISKLENHIVSFLEEGDCLVVKVEQPRTERIMGGGDAECRIRLSDFKILSCVFSR